MAIFSFMIIMIKINSLTAHHCNMPNAKVWICSCPMHLDHHQPETIGRTDHRNHHHHHQHHPYLQISCFHVKLFVHLLHLTCKSVVKRPTCPYMAAKCTGVNPLKSPISILGITRSSVSAVLSWPWAALWQW